MIVVMMSGAGEPQIQAVIEELSRHGFDVHRSSGLERTVLGAIGVKPGFDHLRVAVLPGVDVVHRVTRSEPGGAVAVFGPVRVGGGTTTVFARARPDGGPHAWRRLVDAWPRIAGVVVGPLPGRHSAGTAEGARMLHELGAALIVEPLAGEAASDAFGSADGLIVRESGAGVLESWSATGIPLILARDSGDPPGPVAATLPRPGDPSRPRESALLLSGPGPAAACGPSTAVPVLVDATGAAEGGPWAAAALACVAAGADGVVMDCDESARRRFAGLVAVAASVGRPVARGVR